MTAVVKSIYFFVIMSMVSWLHEVQGLLPG